MPLPIDFAYPVFAAILLLTGIAMGLFASPNRAAVMNSLPAGDRGAGGGMNQTFQNSAQVISIGIFFTLLSIGLSSTLPLDAEQRPAGPRRLGGGRAPGRPTCRRSRSCSPPSSATTRSSTWSAPHALAALPAARPRRAHRPRLLPAPDLRPVQRRPARRLHLRDRRLPDRRRRLPAARRPLPPRRRAGRRPASRRKSRNWRNNMRVEWHGQSAFTLTGDEAQGLHRPVRRHVADWPDRGMKFDYPPIEADDVDLLLITHEHVDHNGVEAIARRAGRYCARPPGTLESPIGEVVGDRLRARRRGRDRARPEHDLRLRPGRRSRRPLRRLRPGASCAPSRPRPSEGSTCSSCRSAAGRRSAPAQAAAIVEALGRAGSCRCTTARRGSASWRPRRSSSTACRMSRGSRRAASTPPSCPMRTARVAVVPAAP